MIQKSQSYTEGLAQITTEEGQLAYGIQRYVLGVIAAVLWIVFILYTFTDATFGFKWQGQTNLFSAFIFGILAAAFSVGSWWANRIHHKLTTLQSAVDNE